MKLRAQSISCAASASLALVALFVPTSVAHSSAFLFLFVLAALWEGSAKPVKTFGALF